MEPLLGEVYLPESLMMKSNIWVIAGGESGKNARPMNPAWVNDILNDP